MLLIGILGFGISDWPASVCIRVVYPGSREIHHALSKRQFGDSA